jgi:hypothetical protein
LPSLLAQLIEPRKLFNSRDEESMVAPPFLRTSEKLGVKFLVVLDTVNGKLEEAIEGDARVGGRRKRGRVRKGGKDRGEVRVRLDGGEGIVVELKGGGVASVGGFEVRNPSHEEVAESFGGRRGRTDVEKFLQRGRVVRIGRNGECGSWRTPRRVLLMR